MLDSAKKFVETYVTQKYGHCDYCVPFDRLKNQYASLPNETVYVVDCKTAQIEPLTQNFKNITGIDIPHKNEMTPLIEHVTGDSLNGFLKFTTTTVNAGFRGYSTIDLIPEKDWLHCIYKSHDGKLILKSSALLAKDSYGKMRYAMGKLTDITGLIPEQTFNFRFDGPSSEKMTAEVLELQDLQPLLSPRELEILNYIGKGMTSQQIADLLFLSKHTVDTHRRKIIEKLETTGTIKAYNKAKDMGLV